MITLGIHQEEENLVAALVEWDKKNINIQIHSLPANVKLFDILPLRKISRIVSGLETRQVCFRSLEIQLQSKRALLKTLPFQVEGVLPYPEEELILLPLPMAKKKDLSLLATGKQSIQAHIDNLKEREIDPDQVSCVPLALSRFARFFYPEPQSLAVFHFGEEESSLILLEGNQIKLAQAISFSRRHPETKAIERMLDYLKKKAPSCDQLLLTGIKDEKIEPLFSSHFEILSWTGAVELWQTHAVAIGLALEGKEGVQLRIGPFRSEKAKVHQKKMLLSCCLACAVCAMITWGGGQLYLHQEKKALLATLPAKSQSLELALSELESSCSYEKNVFLEKEPSLSDFLTWVSVHPALSKEISVERVHYNLIKDPKKGKLAKVQLLFNCSELTQARKIREILMNDTQHIDQSHGVKWSAERDQYLATFLFK